MKKLLYLFTAICMLSTACDFETSDNGSLDGYWQLSQLDTLTAGSSDMRSSGLFWSVQVRLLEIRNNFDANRSILFRFEQKGDYLRLWNPVADNKNISDSVITSPVTLAQYNIEGALNAEGVLESTLKVEQLDDDRMVLSNSGFRFHFRKY